MWRTFLVCPHPSRIVVRFHGADADELPVWQADIQNFLSKGVAYLSVDYDIGDSNGDYKFAILQAIESFLANAGISDNQAVLFGYSAGADFALAGLADNKTHFRAAILCGLNLKKDIQLLLRSELNETKLVFVEASEDRRNSLDQLQLRKALPTHSTLISVQDTHLLIHPSSWFVIQRLLEQALGNS
jgi:predicted esterase